jgi:phenylacetic acid degradation operon negative regulatory protein
MNATSPTSEVDLPRRQRGTPPQHLLTTILGDYWWGRREGLPSAAMVRLAGEFSVTPLAARAALSRLVRRGLLEVERQGRRASYALTEKAELVLTEGIQRIVAFGMGAPSWDGRWTVAAFSLPEQSRDLRHLLRTRLRWLGFAPLYDGMWVSAHDAGAAARKVFEELGVEQSTVLRGELVAGPGGRSPIAAWDLDELRQTYQDFVDTYAPLRERLAGGQVGPTEALVARTELMDTWRTLPSLDPELPKELLPSNWPMQGARAVFVEVYDDLGPLAEIRVRQIVGELDGGLASLVRHHTTTSILDEAPLLDRHAPNVVHLS